MSKLTVARVRPNPCESEQTTLIQCLKPKDSVKGGDNLLKVDCVEAVNAYVSCATTASAIQ